MEKVDVKALVNKWEPVLQEGSSIKTKHIEKITAIMLENELSYLTNGKMLSEGTTWSPTADEPQGAVNYQNSGDADFYKIAIPMVRRTFPNLLAHEVVGVQPLTAPVGLAFALRYRADQTYAGARGTEVGYNTIDPYYSGNPATSAAFTRAEGEALGSNTVPDVGTPPNEFPGTTGGLGIGNGSGIRELSMTLEKAQVEAGTRKLKSRWSVEVAQDLRAMHGLNLEEEMMDVLAYEITAEIDRELIAKIKGAADMNASSQTIDYQTDLDGRWEAEKYRNIYNLLIRKSNQIAIDTRRGAGNFTIASPTMCAALEATSAFTVWPTNEDINTATTGVAKVGSLDGRMMVYRDTFATVDDVVVGYKGASSYDTGIVYLPYIQLMVSKATYEDSFQPSVGLMSRYAIHEHMFGASNYYIRVQFSNMNRP
jgi:hypothetical protein